MEEMRRQLRRRRRHRKPPCPMAKCFSPSSLSSAVPRLAAVLVRYLYNVIKETNKPSIVISNINTFTSVHMFNSQGLLAPYYTNNLAVADASTIIIKYNHLYERLVSYRKVGENFGANHFLSIPLITHRGYRTASAIV